MVILKTVELHNFKHISPISFRKNILLKVHISFENQRFLNLYSKY